MKFSPSTGNFYPPEFSYAVVPDDVVDVLPGEYEKAMARAPGETFSVQDGRVEIVGAPQITPEALKAATRAEALKRLASTDYSQLPDVNSSLKNAKAFTEYRAAVRAILLRPVEDPDWPTAPKPIWA